MLERVKMLRNTGQLAIERRLPSNPSRLDSSVLDNVFSRYPESDTIFVFVGLSDIKTAFQTNPYELLVEKLNSHFENVLAPGYTPSFKKTGIYHKLYSKPEHGTFSKLFLQDIDYRTDDALHSILVKGDYRFPDCEHQKTFSEDGCFAKLDRDNVLYLSIGTDWFIPTFVHYLEMLYNVPYVESTKHDGVVYYDETRHGEITQHNHHIDWYIDLNRPKIQKTLIENGVLDYYDLKGLKIWTGKGHDMHQILREEVKEDPYFFVT